MKRLLLLCFLWCYLPIGIYAQTFHAIVFADTDDSTIGASCYHDYERMTIELATMATANQMKLKRYFYKYESFNKRQLLETIQNMEVGSQDIVAFYFTGHGVRSDKDNSPYPQLSLGTSISDLMALEKVDALIAAKNPRLRIVLADCCNAVGQGVIPQNNTSGGATQLQQAEVNSYQSLLQKLKGNVLVSSSSVGEFSIAMAQGGLFTLSLLHELQKVVIQNGDVGWNDLLASTRLTADDWARDVTGGARGQLAQFHVKVVPVSGNAKEDNTPAPQRTQKDGLPDDFIDALAWIIDYSKSDEERMKWIQPIMNKFFADKNAKIDIIGRNGTTLVDRFTAEQFLKRLAIVKRLAQVVWIDGKTNTNGKYTELRLHEIYKF